PALLRRVYADGARIFVELGPGSTCSGYVEATLAGQEHVPLSLDKRGVDSHRAIVRALARLVAHRVPLDLAPLYRPPTSSAERPTLPGVVPVAAPAIRAAILTDENRRRFAA